ncbi:MAG: LamG-like jellyroll fold domain-containing protein [Patescibacteria group bacterium]
MQDPAFRNTTKFTRKSQQIGTNYVKITWASRLLGISPHTLRRLEEKGDIIPVRLPNGHRLYNIDDVKKLQEKIQNKQYVKEEKYEERKEKAKSKHKHHKDKTKYFELNEKLETTIKGVKNLNNLLLGILFLFSISLFTATLGTDLPYSLKNILGSKDRPKTASVRSSDVLAAKGKITDFIFNVNIPSIFNAEVTTGETLTAEGLVNILGGLTTNTLTFTNPATMNNLLGINDTTKTTLEEALNINGEVTGTGLGDIVIADGVIDETKLASDIAYDGDFDFTGTISIGGSQISATASELNYLSSAAVSTGGIIFGDGSKFTQDSISFFWNNTLKRLGIGTNSPTASLDLLGATATSASLRVRSGTAPTSPNTGDFYSDGTNIYYYNGATWNDLTDSGLWTLNGTEVYYEGNVGIGTTNPGYKLDVNGNTNTTGLYLGGIQVTSTGTELNYLDGSSVESGGVIHGDGSKFANTGTAPNGYFLISKGSSTPTWNNPAGLTIGQADTLDGIDSLQFLRSDATDTFDVSGGGTLYIASGNYLDILGSFYLNGSGVTATANEINVLNGMTSSTSELNYLDGISISSIGVVYTDGSKFANTGEGTSGYILQANGTAPPSWVNPTGIDAGSLDGFDSTSFLRSDTSDQYTSGTLTINSGAIFDVDGDLLIADNDIAFDSVSYTNFNFTNDFSINDNNFFLDKQTAFVGLGNTAPSERLMVNGRVYLAQTTAPSPTTDRLYNVSGSLFWNGTQLDTGGVTLYSNSGTVPAGSYIEVAHSQPTFDVLATGWIEGISGTWTEIDDFAGTDHNTEDPELVTWFRMDENSGNLDNAEGTATNDLVSKSDPNYQIIGKINWGLELSGNDYFCSTSDPATTTTCDDNNNLDFEDDSFTLGGWFKHSTMSGTSPEYIISKYSDSAALDELGDGLDGDITISIAKNINTETIATGRSYADGIAYRVVTPTDGSSSATRYTTVTLSNGIAVGDEVLLINLQGASGDVGDVGNYEIMKVESVTSTTVTFTEPITVSFDGTTASNQKVIIQRIPNYEDVTIANGGSLTASAWDGLATTPTGSAGYYTGIVAFKASGTVTIEGGGSITVSAKGYRGGAKGSGTATGSQGESIKGTGSVSTSANDGGGGGGYTYVGTGDGGDNGGGGGYGSIGETGIVNGASGTGGAGGNTYGSSDLSSSIFFGSGGGGGGSWTSNGGDGGAGGGILYIAANNISLSGNIYSKGGSGVANTGSSGNGGSGSGGSVILNANTLTLGSNLVDGLGGTAYADGGNGRIYIQYSTSSSGTTTPGAEASQVTSSSGGYKLYMESDGDITFAIDDDDISFPEDTATTVNADYDDGTWHHVVAVKNSTSSIKLYVDGEEVASDYSLISTYSISNSDPFLLGVDDNQSSDKWNGSMDEVFVYDRALSPGEIKELYQSNKKYKIEQPNNTTVRLYNNSQNTQTLRLNILESGADVAEWYTVNDNSLEAGDIVVVTGNLDEYKSPIITKSDGSFDNRVIGIISSNANIKMGIERDNRKLVALSGRVPVKISPNSPTISAGDYITSSDIPGFGKKAIGTGRVVGVALENWYGGKETILILVDPTWFSIANDVVANNTSNNVLEEILELRNEILDNVSEFIDFSTTFSLSKEEKALVASVDMNILGDLTLNNLNVGGNILAGQVEVDTLENSINIAGPQCSSGILCQLQTLYLQKTLSGNIDMFDGKVMFEPDGSMTINKLILENNKTAGSSAIKAGDMTIFVATDAITIESKVMITPTKLVEALMAVTNKIPNQGFEVSLTKAAPEDITFDWLVVDTK